ncbi:hypothetical protein EV356DRAFT_480576 [Viridothelium virens]|uniref:Uncharacterized protein n=1 Tax=Viridothelium virens TaxID=1048519 RepID=A0A6A6HIA8_VIRVR|nr:hypothetical protein EV356DRAFT_480576 [Viridothelium virens]
MHYVRFLKPPYLDSEGDRNLVKCLITITTDLGESFYPQDVPLAATLRSHDPDGDIFLRRTLPWSQGMRSIPLAFDITNSDVDWPLRVHIGPKNSPFSDHFESQHPGAPPAVISAWSGDIQKAGADSESPRMVERRFTPFSDRIISIWEETGESIARHLWDAGVVLAGFLDRVVSLQEKDLPILERTLVSATYKRLNVLELGCGCGIVGIAMAQTIPDCSVILTDTPEVEEIVTRNISNMNPAISSAVHFQPLNWEAELPLRVRERTLDMIVAADCTYNPDSAQDLVRTIAALVSRSPRAIVIISMKTRHPSEAIFFELLSAANLTQASHSSVALPDDDTPVDIFVYHSHDRPMTREKGDSSVLGKVQ